MVKSNDKATHALKTGFKLQSKERTYEIVKVLGSGSYGITYLATAKVSIGNIITTIRFAIKEHFMSASCYRGEDGATVLTVPTAKSDVAESRADFITEANRLKKLCLKSRNIVSVNETFEANGTAYYVMEFLDGGSPSKCPEEEAVSIVKQIADALNEIHKEHVLHLDLKPDNIVLKTNDKNETYPVLIDFGLSKHFDTKGRPTSSLSSKGASPGYAPQEQYAGVIGFSPKYDIYALGAVLFYLSTGKNPPDAFKISPNQQELKKALTGNVSPNIEKTILNAMKPAAMERTSSIKQFSDDLMGIDFIPILNISSSALDFDKEKAERTVSIESNIGWTVYADNEWCKVSRSDNNIIITVKRNKESGSRICDVVVNGTSYQISQVIRIKQKGTGTVVFSKGPTRWEKNHKKVFQTIGGIALICLLIGLFLFIKTNPEKESNKLSEAIESRDIIALKKFADKDSVRAFKPLIRALGKTDLEQAKYYATKYASIDSIDYLLPMVEILMKEEDYQSAKLYVDKYVVTYPNDRSIKLLQADLENILRQENQIMAQSNANSDGEFLSDEHVEIINESKAETNDEKFARATNDFNLMLSLAKDNYAKAYYPLAEMYYNRKNLDNAKSWATKAVNTNVNRKQAQNLLSKIEPQNEPSNDDLFAKATTLEDFRLLANKGYKKAYAPLAEQYLKKREYDKAHQWAVKAGNANVGLDKARKVIEILSSYGYYDGGEHGGKPNF
ncbi:protein kinase [bacterium]|nr:protein kinase [bacterium]